MNSGDNVGTDRGESVTDRGESVTDTGRCPTPTCGNHVYVLRSQYELLLETGESFYCPAGHKQSFTPKPKLDKQKERIVELERALDNERRQRERKVREANEEKRRCPWPTCEGRLLSSPRGLRQHMVKAHGAPWATPELGVEELGQVLNGRDPAELVK